MEHFVQIKPPLIITADQYLLRKMAINVIIVKKDLHKIESEIKFFLFSWVYSWLLKVIKGLILITELETFYAMVFDLWVAEFFWA